MVKFRSDFEYPTPLSHFENAKPSELRFRALLTDDAKEVRFDTRHHPEYVDVNPDQGCTVLWVMMSLTESKEERGGANEHEQLH